MAMKGLRFSVLIAALALSAWPASARIDDEVFAERIARLAPVQSAMREALDAALAASAPKDAERGVFDGIVFTNDPVEEIVIAGVVRAYEANGLQPFWLGRAPREAHIRSLQRLMGNASDYGLDAAAYRTPDPTLPRAAESSLLVQADIRFSITVARFVTHMASGHIRPKDVSEIITLEPERPDIAAVLARLATSTTLDSDLAAYEPPHPQYRALKAALKTLRSTPEEPRIVVPEGELLKPGMLDERVPLLRTRLDLATPPDADPELYDDVLVDAVKLAQAEAELTVDGIVGPRTLLTLNGRSREEEIASLVVNLERWRWMPRELGAFHVMVNVPEFVARVVDRDSVLHATKVVVGGKFNRTPIFSHLMSHIVVNPYWHVPTSIIRAEMIPAGQRNPGYFFRDDYEVFARINGRFRQVNPYWVDWNRVNANTLQVRQQPGDKNALGRIKFMFPNQHSVYLHDTPSKRLFGRDERALSHGCVRVENPFEFADAILPHAAPEWNSERLRKLFGSAERRVNLDTPVPVHLAYFTATVDSEGALHHFADIYGYDAKITEFQGY